MTPWILIHKMVTLKLILLLYLAKETSGRYAIFDQFCQSIDFQIQECAKQLTRNNQNLDEVAAINRKIFGTSILNPSNYFTIVPEICKYQYQYESFMRCAYSSLQTCLPVEYEKLLPTIERLNEGFTYMCRYYAKKEFTIECYKNNTLQGPKPKDRIREFSDKVETCRIKLSQSLPAILTTNVNTERQRQKNIEDHCTNYNIGYDCVVNVFGQRCRRTRDHIREFYHYLRPELCSAKNNSMSVFILIAMYLFSMTFL